MDWVIEVTNIDGPYCNTNNCNYLKWMEEKRRKYWCYEMLKSKDYFFPLNISTMSNQNLKELHHDILHHFLQCAKLPST